MSDAADKPEAATEEKPTDVLGELNGVPFTRADEAKAKDAKPVAKESTDAEHHAALTKRHDVIAVVPAHKNRYGQLVPEKRTEPGEVTMVSLRCAVAHRTLHGCSPDEVKQLRAAFDAKYPLEPGQPNDEKRATAFEHFALRHIDGVVEGVPDALATQELLDKHAHAKHVAKHRAKALAALPKSDAAPAAS